MPCYWTLRMIDWMRESITITISTFHSYLFIYLFMYLLTYLLRSSCSTNIHKTLCMTSEFISLTMNNQVQPTIILLNSCFNYANFQYQWIIYSRLIWHPHTYIHSDSLYYGLIGQPVAVSILNLFFTTPQTETSLLYPFWNHSTTNHCQHNMFCYHVDCWSY